MSFLTTTTEWILGALLLILIVLVVWANIRRRRIAGGGFVTLAAVRTQASPRWRLGQLRMGASTLEWFTIGGPSSRPKYAWSRWNLDLGLPKRLEEDIPGLSDPVRVSVRIAGEASCELALHEDASKAVRAWLESSPPGYNTNVA